MIGCATTPHKTTDLSLQDDSQPTKAKTKAPKVSKEAIKYFKFAVSEYNKQKKKGRFKYESLLARFEQALDKDSKLAEAHYNIGCIYEAMRKDEEAVKHYKKALNIRPDLTLAAANWGALLGRHGKLDDALQVYKRALSAETKNSPVLLNVAGIYLNQKKYDQALETASKVLVRDPSNVGAYRIMASVYNHKGDLDMAHLVCLRGLQVKQDDPSLHNTLGVVLLKLGRTIEALNEFRKALKHAPDMISTRLNVAKIALDYRDFRVAKQEFSRVLQYEPRHKKAAMGLGITMRGTGDFNAAKKQFTMLAKKYKKDAFPHWWLGILALRNFNDVRTAIKEFKKFKALSGSGLSSKHPVSDLLKECQQNVEMDKKMKEMEKKMAQEAKRQAAFEKKLAAQRQKAFSEAWAKAVKNKDVMPPKKPDYKTMPFVLVPVAVTPDQDTLVTMAGADFKGTLGIVIGQFKPKWKKLNPTTIQMIVPQGIPLGPWDLLITLKDGNEIYFKEGLWVGKAPEKKETKPEKGKEDRGKKKAKDSSKKGKAKKIGK